eukprot:83259-Chlamydomonas_euryale.AAC.6
MASAAIGLANLPPLDSPATAAAAIAAAATADVDAAAAAGGCHFPVLLPDLSSGPAHMAVSTMSTVVCSVL